MTTTTLDYYNAHASSYSQSTIDVDMSALYNEFLPILPQDMQSPAHILDLGCGSGRDSKHFLAEGYQVTAIEPAQELAECARKTLNQPVQSRLATEITEHNCYHGVWACASLLHIPYNQLHQVFQNLANALKPSGVIYASFKYGEGERHEDGREFTDLTETCLKIIINQIPTLRIYKLWLTQDRRPSHSETLWLNVLLTKD